LPTTSPEIRTTPARMDALDDPLLADDEAVVGDDLAAEAAVQHHGAGERVLPSNSEPSSMKAVRSLALTDGLFLLPPEHGRVPRGGLPLEVLLAGALSLSSETTWRAALGASFSS